MKLPMAALAVTMALSAWSTPTWSCPKSNCLRIGSWNIEWFGSSKRRATTDDKTIQAMADMIADELSIDLIVLQEINTELEGEKYNDRYSREPWKTLETIMVRKGYQSASGSSGEGQHLVMLWRSNIISIRKPYEPDVPDQYEINKYCRSAGLRKPLTGYFRSGKFDFWVTGVHLKSSYGGKPCNDEIRVLQVDALIKSLEKAEKKDPDVILVGDFNASAKHKSLGKLIDAGFNTLNDKLYRSKSSNSYSQRSLKTANNSGSMIDHIMIRREYTTEWEFGSTTVYKPEDSSSFTETFSDHFPVWADFSTDRDDD